MITCRCSVCYAAQYGKQPEIQQGWQTSAVAIHLVVARLLSVSAIFCLDCMPRPFTKCRQLAAIAAIAANLDLAPDDVRIGRLHRGWPVNAHEGIWAGKRASIKRKKNHKTNTLF